MLLEEGVCYDQCIFLAKLLVFALLHVVLHGQICLVLQVSLDTFFIPTFSLPSSMMKRSSFFCCCLVLVLIEPFNFSFFSISGWSIDLDYCDIEWLTLEMNRDLSVVFEIASKYCISDSFLTMVATPFLLKDSCPQ